MSFDVPYGHDFTCDHGEPPDFCQREGCEHNPDTSYLNQFAAEHHDDQPPADTRQADFWAARYTLGTIRAVARQRLVSPWATLGGVLANVCARVGPHVTLPALRGGNASLNTFWALVGPSGSGKGAALAVARELLWLDDDVPTHEIGTGQGIDSAYTAQGKDGPVQFCDAALFEIPEIDTLAGHAKMSGATIMPTLRKVYSGEALGARYADRHKRRPVKAHRYRAAVVAGVQPARSAVLLSDADGGTPQRWLWLPTNDPDAGTVAAEQVPVPDHGVWQAYEYLTAYGERDEGEDVPRKRAVEIKVCDQARSMILAHHQARLSAPLLSNCDGDLDGHALLTRLKVAALLGLFDGRAEVADEDWQLAEVVMSVSDATRELCAQVLAEQTRKANTARALAEAERSDIVAEQAEQRVARAVSRVLAQRGDWVSRAELRRRVRQPDRPMFDPAIERLRAAGQIEERESERGTQYRYPTG